MLCVSSSSCSMSSTNEMNYVEFLFLCEVVLNLRLEEKGMGQITTDCSTRSPLEGLQLYR